MEEELIEKYYQEYVNKCIDTMFSGEDSLEGYTHLMNLWAKRIIEKKYFQTSLLENIMYQETANLLKTKDMRLDKVISEKYALVSLKNKHNAIVSLPDMNILYEDEQLLTVKFINDSSLVINRQSGANYLKDGKLIFKQWLFAIGSFNNGLAIIRDYHYTNIMDINGNLLFDEWLVSINTKENPFIIKNKSGYYNYFYENKIISEEWFRDVEPFKNGYARVKSINERREHFITLEGKPLKDAVPYEIISDFNEGYSIVMNMIDNCRVFNYIDTEGNLFFETWKRRLSEFVDGFAVYRETNGLFGVVSIDKTIIIKDIPYEIVKVSEGIAKVYVNNNFYNIIDSSGNLLSNEHYYEIRDFHFGFAPARLSSSCKWTFINKQGKRISMKEYDDVFDFDNDLAAVKKAYKYCLINTNGNELLEEWFDEIIKIDDEHFKVRTGNSYNIVNLNGQKLITDYFDLNEDGTLNVSSLDKVITNISEFIDGFAIIEIGAKNSKNNLSCDKEVKYNYIDRNMSVVSRINFSKVEPFKNGLAKVFNSNNQENYINTEGNLILDKWYDSLTEFENGYLLSLIGNYRMGYFYNIIDVNGKKHITFSNEEKLKNILNIQYARLIDYFYEDETHKIIIKEQYKYFIYDENIKTYKLFFDLQDIIARVKEKGTYFFKEEYLIEILMSYFLDRRIEVNTGPVKKTLTTYKIEKTNQKTKYKPYYIYDNHIICGDKNNFYLYYTKTRKYKKIGERANFVFYNNMIVDLKEKKAYYLDSINNDLIDITAIYEKKLKYAGKVVFDRINIMDYVDFKAKLFSEPNFLEKFNEECLNLRESRKAKREELLRKKLEEEETLKLKNIKEELRTSQHLDREKEIAREKALKETLQQIASLFQVVETLSRKETIKKKNIIYEDILFNTFNDHKEIRDEFKRVLKYLDLFAINFSNVLVSGIDFSDTNANINPQTVYKKNMSNSNFSGVKFSLLSNFEGVDIRNSIFSLDSLCSINFKGAITDDATIIPGEKTIVRK